MNRRRAPRPASERESGIALMVVMVVFIILYLVVFQLHYTTRLEERLSKARAADSQGSVAIQSVAYMVLGLLSEKIQKGGQQDSGGGMPQAGAPGAPGGRGGGAGGPSDAKKQPGGGLESSAGTDPLSAAQGIGAGGPSWVDYLHEDALLDNSQSLNNVTVKISTIDNERAFDLNRLWDYPPLRIDSLSDANQERADETTRRAAEDKVVSDILSMADPKKKASPFRTKSKSKTKSGTSSKGGIPTVSGAAEEGQAEEDAEWVPPSAERRQETVKMLERAIDLMIRLNVENGFDYKVRPKDPPILAEAIERYAYERRSQPYQNYIHLASEILNVLAMVGDTPEVFYGPVPDCRSGDDFVGAAQTHRYRKDEYGDLVGEYLYAEDMSGERDMMEQQLKDLQSIYGQFAPFPELGRMGNPMTRNMRDYSEIEDEKGNVSLAVPPMPLGLKDLFTTFSTGKININTAPVPILYSLLPLIIETEQAGALKAQGIALNIELYRNTYQPEYDDSDPTAVEAKTAMAGAPHRQPPQDGVGAAGRGPRKKASTGSDAASSLLASSGALDAAGLTGEELAQAVGGSGDYQTNYFTNLNQLKLIDGEDEGKDDYLTDKGSGTTTNDLEQKTPLQKVMHDYGQVMVFGSTYFTATLKSKAEDSPAIKTGYLTVVRDMANRRMEVIQWKELQK